MLASPAEMTSPDTVGAAMHGRELQVPRLPEAQPLSSAELHPTKLPLLPRPNRDDSARCGILRA